MAPISEQAEQHYAKLMQLFSKRYTALYVVLAVFSGYFAVDLCMPVVTSTSTIEKIGKHEELHSSGRGRYHTGRPRTTTQTKDRWLVLHLADGTRFQTRGGFSYFRIGDTLELEATPFRHHVFRYRRPTGSYKDWFVITERYDEINLFPVLVFGVCVLLLLPIRSLQFRWIMHFVLVLTVFPWLLSMIGTEGLTLFY